jgi:hypothetical protein
MITGLFRPIIILILTYSNSLFTGNLNPVHKKQEHHFLTSLFLIKQDSNLASQSTGIALVKQLTAFIKFNNLQTILLC